MMGQDPDAMGVEAGMMGAGEEAAVGELPQDPSHWEMQPPPPLTEGDGEGGGAVPVVEATDGDVGEEAVAIGPDVDGGAMEHIVPAE